MILLSNVLDQSALEEHLERELLLILLASAASSTTSPLGDRLNDVRSLQGTQVSDLGHDHHSKQLDIPDIPEELLCCIRPDIRGVILHISRTLLLIQDQGSPAYSGGLSSAVVM